MLTIVANNENSRTISIPADELEKLGIAAGEEVEFSKENNEIILRSTAEAERKRKFEKAKNKIFEEWHDVFVELAKGADDEITKPETQGKFVLIKAENEKYRFILIADEKVFLESADFDSLEDAKKAIDSVKKEISKLQNKILDFPVTD